MARRAAPPGAGPAYYSAAPPRRAIHDPNESAFSRFMREEIWAPEKLPGNIGILSGLVVFFGGIAAVRTWGELMIPAFTELSDKMSLLASSRSAARHVLVPPAELWVSCFHTSPSRQAVKPKPRGSLPPPSRTKLVKDVASKKWSKKPKKSSRYEPPPVVEPPPKDPVPHEGRQDMRNNEKEVLRMNFDRPSRRPRRRSETSRKEDVGPLPSSLSLSEDLDRRRGGVGRQREDAGPSTTTVPLKPKVVTRLTDESVVSSRSESVEGLPSEFTSPPLMEGLLEMVVDVLGPHARPTPIQALSLKHLFKRPSPSSSTENSPQYHQYLLASETGSGKSIAYLLPLLQNLKLSELERAKSTSEPRDSGNRRASNPLSSFAKDLLHVVKLRVMCASRANTQSRQRVTASKMAEAFENVEGEFTVGANQRGKTHPVDVLVGTPSKILEAVRGRKWDHEEPKFEDTWDTEEGGRQRRRKVTVGEPQISLADVEWVVVDEADVLFDPDFQEETRMLLADISAARGHPVPFEQELDLATQEKEPSPLDYPFNLILSTATVPASLASYLDRYHPALTRLASPNLHHLPRTLTTEYAAWSGGNRDADIEQRIRRVWYEDAQNGVSEKSKILVFCNKSARVENLGEHLREKGIPNVALTSSSEERLRGSNHHLDGFLREKGEGVAAKGDAKGKSAVKKDATEDKEPPHVMITTSLLSRGLDFSPSVKHVFIVDEPRNLIDFLHRAGRSGRAGESGKVVIFGKPKGRGSNRTREIRQKVGALVA
ncbi:ATP-dependent RNA helicase MRH4, mitochondrial [Grifola frondosa]|uniref:RNA helicase n=1 Tax=Grifola frondosa TaxID=5627 RepID=A0A1C7MQ82_GRIFR|nr:ATP-dependent RNA helicase MRH4, mitochondrial [Grifola frondosa]